MSTTLKINGSAKTISAADDTPMLWVLRDELKMTGTKFGCGMALCGACTIHVEGQPTRSCVTPLSAVAGKSITTIEGANGAAVEAVKKAWIALDVVQCGYCQPGQIMAAAALLASNPTPSDDQVDAAMAGNLCRCGTYPRIRAAVRAASQALKA
jgi:isoquinoline 1-oxidoreductase subunit alpha